MIDREELNFSKNKVFNKKPRNFCNNNTVYCYNNKYIFNV